eukprot:863797-Pleurochrysis_carterae.AAC.2
MNQIGVEQVAGYPVSRGQSHPRHDGVNCRLVRFDLSSLHHCRAVALLLPAPAGRAAAVAAAVGRACTQACRHPPYRTRRSDLTVRT